jgi:hypothetical protein
MYGRVLSAFLCCAVLPLAPARIPTMGAVGSPPAQTALRYKVVMEYDVKTRERCGHCGDKLEVGQYGKRGVKPYCKSCVEEPSKLIAIFSQPGEVRVRAGPGPAGAALTRARAREVGGPQCGQAGPPQVGCPLSSRTRPGHNDPGRFLGSFCCVCVALCICVRMFVFACLCV